MKSQKIMLYVEETFCPTQNEAFHFPSIFKKSKGDEGIDSQNWKMKRRSKTILYHCQRTLLFCHFSPLYKHLLKQRNGLREVFQHAGYLCLLLYPFPLKIKKKKQHLKTGPKGTKGTIFTHIIFLKHNSGKNEERVCVLLLRRAQSLSTSDLYSSYPMCYQATESKKPVNLRSITVVNT